MISEEQAAASIAAARERIRAAGTEARAASDLLGSVEGATAWQSDAGRRFHERTGDVRVACWLLDGACDDAASDLARQAMVWAS